MNSQGNGTGGNPWGDEKFDFKIKKPDIKLPGASFIVLIIVVVYFASGFFIVAADEQAVIKRFGVVNRIISAGPHYHMPYPFETVDKAVVTQVHRIEIGFKAGARGGYQDIPKESLMLTGDENIVSIALSLQYRITDIESYLYNVNNVEVTIKDAAESAIREVAGREMIDDILTVGKGRIQNETQKILQDMLDYYKTGVTIVAVQLQDVEPPVEVVDSFKDVASAREDKNRFINEAEAYRNELIPRARGQAESMIQEAEAYRKEKVEQALGDTSRFNQILASYSKSPSVTKKRMYFDTMAEVYKGNQKYIFDDSIKNISPLLGLDAIKGGFAK